MSNSPNFTKICQDFLKDLSSRQKEIILRRFGFRSGNRETLESIGRSYQITRERVRQIERDSFARMKPKIAKYQKTFKYLSDYFKKQGELKREDILFSQLGGSRFQPHLHFLLALGSQFSRVTENQEFYPLWTINPNSLHLARKFNNLLILKFKEKETLFPFSDVFNIYKTSSLLQKKNLPSQAILSFVEISKEIEQGTNNLFGLRDWPEINPRGIKDKAFLTLKKEEKPLHFTDIAHLISELNFQKESEKKKKVVAQTVHNELIRDQRFVLVGRGIYALREWGYEPGVVKEIIERILKERGRPMQKKEIIEKVLAQRLVKESTILLNLQNKSYFSKNSGGKYMLRKI